MIQTTHTAITARFSKRDTHIIPNGIVTAQRHRGNTITPSSSSSPSHHNSSPSHHKSSASHYQSSPSHQKSSPSHHKSRLPNGVALVPHHHDHHQHFRHYHHHREKPADQLPDRLPDQQTLTPQVCLYSRKELRSRLTPLQFHVTQEKGTEKEYSGAYVRHRDHGTYSCVVCAEEIFSSAHKYYSGSGWPSFSTVLLQSRVLCKPDPVPCGSSCGLIRLPQPSEPPPTSRHEVSCSGCGSHLGHRFDDGPRPTGTRYCINSAALIFNPQQPRETDV